MGNAVWRRSLSCTRQEYADSHAAIGGTNNAQNYSRSRTAENKGFAPRESHDTDPNLLLRFLKNLGRNMKATGLYFLIGVLLSALFQRYVPAEEFGIHDYGTGD